MLTRLSKDFRASLAFINFILCLLLELDDDED